MAAQNSVKEASSEQEEMDKREKNFNVLILYKTD